MKYLLFILILGAILITAGCVGGNQNSAAIPTPTNQNSAATPTPTSTTLQDSMIGVWRITNSQGYDDRYQFNADGTYVESFYVVDSKYTQLHSGTWSAQGSNSYTKLDLTTGVSKTIIYDPIKNAIYFADLPHLLLTLYQGDIAEGIVFTMVTTIVPTTVTTPAMTPAPDPIEHRYIRQYSDPQSHQWVGYEFRFYPGGTLRYRDGLPKMESKNIIIDKVNHEGSGTWEAIGNNKYLVKYLPAGVSGAPLIVEYTLVPDHEEKDYPGMLIREHIESTDETNAIKAGEEHTGVMYYPERAEID
jgi:hypothetical protein